VSGAGAPAAATAVDAALEGLNEEQILAVTHGRGPLMVVAGPGTGKTAVLTRRVAWLIATKQARPEEILALTFTDKAAAEMEARVDVLVPYGFVGATLSTFHAFGDRLVREHAVELGITAQLRVGTRADLVVFLRERIFELGLRRYLPLGHPDHHLDALLTVFDRARDEDVSPERYRDFAQALRAAAGDDQALVDPAEAELEKAHAYGVYQRLLLEHGRVDFGAQIGLALRLLRERPYLRRELHERYRFVLVDEFQDTNHVQFELIRLLAGPDANLTVVGDDDQSIYRFRGAKIENVLGFLDAYPSARVVVLRRNYRSGQRLLDLSHRMVRHNDPDRLEARDPQRFPKRLIATRAIESRVERLEFATGSDEADHVAREIADTLAAGAALPGDLAVLARTHGQLDAVALSLKALGVRYQRISQRGLYQRPDVMLCLNLLRLVSDPDDGPAAYAVLGDPLFGVDATELARLSAQAHRRSLGLAGWAEAAARSGERISSGSIEGIRRFANLRAGLTASAMRRPTSDVLYEFVSESGLIGQLSAEDTPESAERLQNLSRLFAIVARVGPLLRIDRVSEFIRYLDLLIEAGDDPQAATLEDDAAAVPLLTAHNAKGLEFSVVYLVQMVEGRFPLRARPAAMEFPPELSRSGDPKAEHLREERRLCYVAMTRARDRLVITHARDYGGRSLRKPSRFVVEALGLDAAPAPVRSASALEALARHAPVPAEPAAEPAPPPADRALRLSHGQVDDYLTCPLKYRYAHVVQVPLATDPQAMYGIAIHHAIREYLRQRAQGRPVGEEDALAVFRQSWAIEGFYSREHEERRHAQGLEVLRRFVAREEASGRVPLAVEMEFKFSNGRDFVVGRWDRIDETPAGIVLVDYKTSEVSDAEAATRRAKESLADGQLGLYALAYHETRGRMPAKTQLHFVGSGVIGEATVEPRHLDRARERIAEAAAGIRAAAFAARPDPGRCRYCPYNRICPYRATGPGES
jgi:DNA helicase-2/ATP-dependent DNA helicase PcrA